MAINVAAYKGPKPATKPAPKRAQVQTPTQGPKHNAAATNALRGLIGLGGRM